MITSIQARYNDWAASQIQPAYRPSHTHASEIGHPCVRYHVFNRLCGELRPERSAHLAVLLREGKLHEEDVRRRLSEMQFPVLRAETPFYNDELQLSGRPDGFIKMDGQECVVEIKALGPIFDRINSVADMEGDKCPVFARKYPYQIECYMHSANEPIPGLWVIKSKATGGFKFIPQEPSPERWQAIRERAIMVKNWVIELAGDDLTQTPDNELPAPCDDPAWCADCPWRGSLCHASVATRGVVMATDDALEAMLTRRAELAAAVKEHEDLDKAIKEQAKARVEGAGVVLCGNWSLQVRSQTRKSLKPPKGADVPADWYQESTFQVTTIKEVSDE